MILWQSRNSWEPRPKPSIRPWVLMTRLINIELSFCCPVPDLCACVFMFLLQARKQNSCCEIMWCRCLVLVDTLVSCLSAFPTSPIMHWSPALNINNNGQNWRCLARGCQQERVEGGGRWWSVTNLDCDWWGLKEWWELVRGARNLWIIFNLSNGNHLYGVSIPAGDVIVWRCVLVTFYLQTI